MSSLTPSIKSIKASSSKPKQERIRDNQRRSRARKQEYLADLEKRLRDSHTACREAEIQKLAFADLQSENGNLRQLLAIAGVPGSTVETYLRRSASPRRGSHQPLTMRPLRPKFLPVHSGVSAASPSSCSRSRSVSSMPEEQNAIEPEQSASINMIESTFGTSLGPQVSASTSRMVSDSLATEADSNWTFDRWDHSGLEDSEFGMESFEVPVGSNGSGMLLGTELDKAPSSAADEPPQSWPEVSLRDMDEIKRKLATGFSKPSTCDGGCRVNHQLIMHILSEFNMKHQ
jgi:hypothetical protein